MFTGASALHLDAKGRLAIPSRYREGLVETCQGQLVVTISTTKENCLWMYPRDKWKLVERKVVDLPDFDPNHQKLKRFFIGYASDTEMDKNGRVLLPAPLREFAKMDKGICMLGQGNKFELWDQGLWNSERDQWLSKTLDLENISSEMRQLSL